MIDQKNIEHHIQKHIIGVLMHQQNARFRDMRPLKVDTNLYSYHLKTLIRQDFVKKHDDGYSLTKKGIIYVDRVTTANLDLRIQPKITTMFVIQNSEGQVLLYKRYRQPFVNRWSLPNGKLHITDRSIFDAAKRELTEKLELRDQPIIHAGECYIRTMDKDEVVMSTYVHVFRFETDEVKERDNRRWVKPHRLEDYDLAPAVEQIIARTFFKDEYFFEEFEEDWYN
jgi:ADP-ribose pyrophosphatase YjhB (NUDIX family)